MDGNLMKLISFKIVLLSVVAPAAVLCMWMFSSIAEVKQKSANYNLLDLSDVDDVIGGVSTDIKWPTEGPWYQSYDNLRFNIDIVNHFGTPNAIVTAWADSSKVGYEIVSTPGPTYTGTLHRRFDWPFPGPRDLQLKYFHDNQFYLTVNENTLTGQYLLGSVKVHTVKFWNATSPSMSTNVPGSISKALIDNNNKSIPDRMTNVDGIYAENCGVETKTQWRYAGTGTMQISDTCMDMMANGGTYAGCLDEFNNHYATDTNNVHVVWIKSNQSSGAAGAHWKNGSKYMITLRDDWATNPDLDALLAHEFGHTYVGGHSNDIYDCTIGRADRNLMCDNVGRVMDGAQCASGETSNRYTNRKLGRRLAMFTTVNKLVTIGLVSTLFSVPVFSVEKFGDGIVESEKIAPDIKEEARPYCILDSDACPHFPISSAFSRSEISDALKAEAICDDGGTSTEEIDRLSKLLQFDSKANVAAAISNVMLSDPNLQLHDLKIGVKMLADLDIESSIAYLNELYKESVPLVKRIVQGADLRHVSEGDIRDLILRQAADIRRNIVLALQGKTQSSAFELISKALDDNDASVSLSAARVLQRQPD